MIEPKLFKNLYNLEHKPVKTYNFDLKKFKNFLKEFSSPENDIGKVIHVAGTNGKGSVVEIISQILIESSYRVGTYTSPHIKYVNERIKINNRMISDKDFKRYEKLVYENIKNKCKDYRTFFESITTLAFLYFKEKKVDYSVLEVGLGGRLDSTNVVEKALSVITKIDYDHTHLLGDTIEKISFEKGGIIKKNSIVFTFKQNKSVLDVLKSIAHERKSKLIVVNANDYTRKTNGFVYNDEFYKFRYPYSYQIENAILSLNIAKFLGISEKYIKKGIENFKIEGRGEIICKNPLIIVDGSHNPAAVERTLRELKELYPERKINSISVFMSDKDYKKSIEILKKYASKVFLTEIDFFRCAKISDYAKIKGVNLFNKVEDAFENALERDRIILFIGSFYLIEKAKKIIKNYVY